MIRKRRKYRQKFPAAPVIFHGTPFHPIDIAARLGTSERKEAATLGTRGGINERGWPPRRRVVRRQGECNFHEVAVQFTPLPCDRLHGRRRAQIERGGKEHAERQRERWARGREGDGARTREHTYVHEEEPAQ